MDESEIENVLINVVDDKGKAIGASREMLGFFLKHAGAAQPQTGQQKP